MADRRTRDQLRESNLKLRAAIRYFVFVQDGLLEPGVLVPAEWKKAYLAMKELMGTPNESEEPK